MTRFCAIINIDIKYTGGDDVRSDIYSLLVSGMRYFFVAAIVYILFRIVYHSVCEYNELRRVKNWLEKGYARHIEFLPPFDTNEDGFILAKSNIIGRAEKFNYHQMRLCELYDYLVEAEQSNGKEETAILCCTCDEVGCGAVVTDIIKTPDKVIWQNIRDRDKADGFSITFVFQAQVYKNFMRQLQKAATGEKQKG